MWWRCAGPLPGTHDSSAVPPTRHDGPAGAAGPLASALARHDPRRSARGPRTTQDVFVSDRFAPLLPLVPPVLPRPGLAGTLFRVVASPVPSAVRDGSVRVLAVGHLSSISSSISPLPISTSISLRR